MHDREGGRVFGDERVSLPCANSVQCGAADVYVSRKFIWSIAEPRFLSLFSLKENGDSANLNLLC